MTRRSSRRKIRKTGFNKALMIGIISDRMGDVSVRSKSAWFFYIQLPLEGCFGASHEVIDVASM